MPTTGVEAGGCAAQPLDSDRLRLRPVVAGDAPAIAQLAADPDVACRTARMPHPYTLADAEAWIAHAQDRPGASEFVRAITMRADDALIGAIGIKLDANGAGGEFGYWLGKPYWGRGIVTEAVQRLQRFAFEELSLPRVRANVLPDNPASARVLEKAGFAFAGPTTCDAPARGGSLPARAYVLSRDEWLSQHALPTVLVAAAALIDADGRVLLAQRPAGKEMAGLWEFPGGKVAAGETPEAALIRELREELGIDVRTACLAPIGFASHRYPGFHLLMPLFACRVWTGDPRAEEHTALAWVRPQRLGDYAMPPADAPLVAMLRDLL